MDSFRYFSRNSESQTWSFGEFMLKGGSYVFLESNVNEACGGGIERRVLESPCPD